MIFLDFILDVVGYTTARLLLPTLTFQKVKVDALSSDEVGFNWLGFKRLPNGRPISGTMRISTVVPRFFVEARRVGSKPSSFSSVLRFVAA